MEISVSEIAHGPTCRLGSLNDRPDRGRRSLGGGEVIDIGRAKRGRRIDTPDGGRARVRCAEPTGTLLCGDLW